MTMEVFMGSFFAPLVLVGFAAWTAAAVPNSRVPEWSGRAFFLAAAVVWFLGRVS